ncbi:hypothetical protein PSHI_13990 [Pseudomonas sp. URMO17WK12:I11]|nr:hypothetical protein PSHI_13990 [Pseudomonas sp. URMO17WK12:I11]
MHIVNPYKFGLFSLRDSMLRKAPSLDLLQNRPFTGGGK